MQTISFRIPVKNCISCMLCLLFSEFQKYCAPLNLSVLKQWFPHTIFSHVVTLIWFLGQVFPVLASMFCSHCQPRMTVTIEAHSFIPVFRNLSSLELKGQYYKARNFSSFFFWFVLFSVDYNEIVCAFCLHKCNGNYAYSIWLNEHSKETSILLIV